MYNTKHFSIDFHELNLLLGMLFRMTNVITHLSARGMRAYRNEPEV